MKSSAASVDIDAAYAATKPFATSSTMSALFELGVSLGTYASLWVVAVALLDAGSGLFVPVCVIAALFFMRLFLLFHDCLHASLFPQRRANQVCAFLLGLLFFVPAQYWTEEHLAHHATAQNLDRRGRGDVIMLTVAEYLALSRFDRLVYRLLRTLPGLFVVEMLGRWQVLYRLPLTARSGRAARGIMLTNLGLLVVQGSILYLAGWQNYLIVFGLIYLVGGSLGVWIFVLQHDFEGSEWRRDDQWTLRRSPWSGSSFFDLPRAGHWLLNNVTYHHIHHLNPRIPGYNLRACHESDPMFATAPTIGLGDAWRCWTCQLWDEDAGRLISIREAERSESASGHLPAEASVVGSPRLIGAIRDGTAVVNRSDV